MFSVFTQFLCSTEYFSWMYIGIIYDAYTNDSWYRIGKDIYSVKEALKTVKLPLPVACIFDTFKNDFVELNHSYTRYRSELLEKARGISELYLGQSKLNFGSRKVNTNLSSTQRRNQILGQIKRTSSDQ